MFLRESLNHFVIFSLAQIDYVVQTWVEYYNTERPHRGKGIGNRVLSCDFKPERKRGCMLSTKARWTHQIVLPFRSVMRVIPTEPRSLAVPDVQCTLLPILWLQPILDMITSARSNDFAPDISMCCQKVKVKVAYEALTDFFQP